MELLGFPRQGRNLHVSIAVNTPTKTKGVGAGQASDLRWIEASARQVAACAQGHTIVVEKSTLPVRTAEVVQTILSAVQAADGKTFAVLSNPEFLAEGTAIADLEAPDRVLIGGEDPVAIEALVAIYSHWVPAERILRTNLWQFRQLDWPALAAEMRPPSWLFDARAVADAAAARAAGLRVWVVGEGEG